EQAAALPDWKHRLWKSRPRHQHFEDALLVPQFGGDEPDPCQMNSMQVPGNSSTVPALSEEALQSEIRRAARRRRKASCDNLRFVVDGVDRGPVCASGSMTLLLEASPSIAKVVDSQMEGPPVTIATYILGDGEDNVERWNFKLPTGQVMSCRFVHQADGTVEATVHAPRDARTRRQEQASCGVDGTRRVLIVGFPGFGTSMIAHRLSQFVVPFIGAACDARVSRRPYRLLNILRVERYDLRTVERATIDTVGEVIGERIHVTHHVHRASPLRHVVLKAVYRGEYPPASIERIDRATAEQARVMSAFLTRAERLGLPVDPAPQAYAGHLKARSRLFAAAAALAVGTIGWSVLLDAWTLRSLALPLAVAMTALLGLAGLAYGWSRRLTNRYWEMESRILGTKTVLDGGRAIFCLMDPQSTFADWRWLRIADALNASVQNRTLKEGSRKEIEHLIRCYGERRMARRLAGAIVKARFAPRRRQ
ncbi:MAG: hypothetical protein HW416_3421, partial [Chloroflexi bacterium]|nr:hypothetical protein [Chloroflexota bacterium]